MMEIIVKKGQDIANGLAIATGDVPPHYPEIRITDSLPIRLAALSLCFTGNEPTEAQITLMEPFGFREETMPNKELLYIIPNPSHALIQEVIGWDNLRTDYTAAGGTVGLKDLEIYFRIVGRVTIATQILATFMCGKEGFWAKVKCTAGEEELTHLYHYEVLNESFIDNGPLSDVGGWHKWTGEGSEVIFGTNAELKNQRLFGPSELCPVLNHNLFIPFESNYAGVDRLAMNSFFDSFSFICSKPDEDFVDTLSLLTESWVDTISSTPGGDVLAHIIAIAKICVKGHLRPYFIFRPDDHYDGAVIMGDYEFELKQYKVEVVPSYNRETLETEFTQYSFHHATLSKILSIVGNPVASSEVKTMRQLRNLVFQNGRPSGGIENDIRKHLDYLSFDERPESFHVSALRNLVSQISPQNTKEVPDTVYLHRGDFFARPEEYVRLALSQFGLNAPSPAGRGDRVQACSNALKVEKAREYQTKTQRVQFHFTTPATAAEKWIGAMKTGYMSFPLDRPVKYGRCFTGTQGDAVWSLMGDFLSSTVTYHIALQKEKASGPSTSSLGKRGSGGNGGGPSTSKSVVKKSKLLLLSLRSYTKVCLKVKLNF